MFYFIFFSERKKRLSRLWCHRLVISAFRTQAGSKSLETNLVHMRHCLKKEKKGGNGRRQLKCVLWVVPNRRTSGRLIVILASSSQLHYKRKIKSLILLDRDYRFTPTAECGRPLSHFAFYVKICSMQQETIGKGTIVSILVF